MDNLIFPLSKKEAEKSGKLYDSKVNKAAIFPTRLRELRAERKVSQQKLADDIGLTKSTISLYETGDNVPDIKNFVKLADYFEVSYDYLLGQSDSRYKENIDIVERTGLTDDSIKTLEVNNKWAHASSSISELCQLYIMIINYLLDDDNLIEISLPILDMIYSTKKKEGDKEDLLDGTTVFEDRKERGSSVESIEDAFQDIEAEFNEKYEYIKWRTMSGMSKVIDNISKTILEDPDILKLFSNSNFETE